MHCDTYLRGFRKHFYSLANKFVTTFHDPIPHKGADKWDNIETRRITVNASSGYVLLNRMQLNEFSDIYNIPKERILINSLGPFNVIKMFTKGLRRKRTNNILFFGRITPYKGIEYLCEAMKIVHEFVPDATLTIAGGGSMYFDISPYLEYDYISLRN